jgi:hypothetical protein
MGSKLGIKTSTLGFKHDDVYWLDPVDFAFGVAKKLTLADSGRPGTILPLGVFLSAYLRLKFSLQIAGYDAEFFPFDWRLDLRDLGTSLKDYIRGLRENVWLVAHSTGGARRPRGDQAGR